MCPSGLVPSRLLSRAPIAPPGRDYRATSSHGCPSCGSFTRANRIFAASPVFPFLAVSQVSHGIGLNVLPSIGACELRASNVAVRPHRSRSIKVGEGPLEGPDEIGGVRVSSFRSPVKLSHSYTRRSRGWRARAIDLEVVMSYKFTVMYSLSQRRSTTIRAG
jgi:hypothetical protein